MPINYILVDNPLTQRPDDFRAIATTEIIVDEKFLVNFLAQRGNTSTTHYLAVVNEMCEALKYFIQNGYGINLPFLNIKYSINGVFENAADVYDLLRHRLHILVALGYELRKIDTSKIALVKMEASQHQAHIAEVIDTASKQADSVLTPGNILQIIGYLMKVDGDSQENGVFFIHQETQEETKAQFISINTSKNLILLIPALPAGNYNLKIVTQYNGGIHLLKNPRHILFNKNLVVTLP